MRKPQPKTMSVREAAWLYFGIKSDRAAFAALKRGDIVAIRVGKLWRVPAEAMDAKLRRVVDAA